MSKIMLLTTYPINKPVHGGQRRVRAFEQLLSEAKHEVSVLSVTGEDIAHLPSNQRNINYKNYLLENAPYLALLSDYYLAVQAKKNSCFVAIMDEHLKLVNPDILQIEQAWLYPVVKETDYFKKNCTKVIYSSHNVEHELKAVILRGFNFGQREIDHICGEIKAIEDNLAAESHGIIAVSQYDHDYYIKLGCKNVVIAKNCTDNIHFKAYGPAEIELSYVCFIGSAHPPNSSGFSHMMGTFLAYIPPDSRVMFMGGVSDLVRSNPLYKRYELVNESRCIFHRSISDESLLTNIVYSSGILLPITEGGGTNLKTAEAILSGLPVVATTKAFRGFEDYMNIEGVFVTDKPELYRKKVIELLLSPRPKRVERHESIVNALSWSSQIQKILLLY